MALTRNKIAHGQWIVALNRKNTAENPSMTTVLASLDFVRVDVSFRVHEFLGRIIRDLMQSPKKGHFRDFWTNYSNLDAFLGHSLSWSSASKKRELEKKKASLA